MHNFENQLSITIFRVVVLRLARLALFDQRYIFNSGKWSPVNRVLIFEQTIIPPDPFMNLQRNEAAT